MQSYTFKFITQLGDLRGKSVLDVGCGTGIMTAEWAKKVGNTGIVTAVDISREQLAIAERNVKKAKFNNVKFLELDVNNIDNIGKDFDLIYCRFLLAHIENPEPIITSLTTLLRPGGYLICEEPTSYDVLFAYPEYPAFDHYKQMCLRWSEIIKFDKFVGKRLFYYFKQNNLSRITPQSVQPVLLNTDEKNMLWLGTEELAKEYISRGFLTEEQVNNMVTGLKDLAKDDHCLVGFVQYMQIMGRK